LDQKADKTKPNFGILPLPNLETKFISANALIGLENRALSAHFRSKEQTKPLNSSEKCLWHTTPQRRIRNPEIAKLEKHLKSLRHRYFRI